MKQILFIGMFLLLRPPWCHSTVIHDILQPVKDSPKFEDTNGMDGYMAWLFNVDESNEIHVPVKSLDEDISITLPFALRAIFRMEEIESSLFAILGPNGESKLELTLSQSGPELININLHSESLPNKQVSFPESDILENWVDILFVVKDNEIVLKMNCSSPEYVEFEEKIQQIDITDGAELYLGYSGKVERNPFKGAVQEIKIYSGIDDKEIEELCTKEMSLPASGGVRGEALPKPENLQGFLECPPPLIPPPPNGENSCNCSASFVAQILQNMPELKGTPGDKGPPGADGNPGTPGITGKQGYMGERGLPGLQGDRGEKGDDGTPGVDGATGPKGEPGKEGPQGPLGPPGSPGEACKEKEFGKLVTMAREKGDTGPIGPPGTPGLKGQDGEKGEKGSTGIKGEKGDQGHTGADGLRGEKGDRGEAGIDGLPGQPGTHGRPAEKGDKGDRGEQGLIGEPGRPARLSQLLDPDMDPKEVQDIIEKLRGYKGDTGQSGVKGEKGDQGPHGPHGHHGKDGKPGVQGERGPPGESGPQGPIYHIQQTKEETNVIPEKGNKGESGKPGSRGPTGHTGKRGPKGSSGIKGAKGDTGNTGPMGPIGPPGMKGEIGEKGECIIPNSDKFKGEKGAMGPPGVEGKPGQASCDVCSGVPGPPGPQGPPGRPGLSIVGPKGEPGRAMPSKIQNNIDDDEDDWYKSDTVIYKNTKSLFKRSATIPLGTLAYVIREKILLVRVETGWQYVVMGSIMEYRDPTRDLFTTTISSHPVMSSPHRTTTVEPIAAIREPTLAKVARSDQRVIHIAALNAPYDGKMLSETNNTFYNGANYDCQQQAQRYHFGDTYEVFLANQHQDLRDAVISSDHNLPVVNIKEQVLFKSWKSMFDGSGALFSIESGADIYSFSGRNVLLDPIWPKKAVWHGGSSSGHVSRNCNGWQTNSRDHSGVASNLNESKLLGEKKYTCDSSLVVLCIQTIGTPPRRNERPRTVYRRQRHPIARRRKYESHRHNQLV